MIVAGIDEAGYGPTLGPLVVAGTAFEVPDRLENADFWEVLSQSVCQQPGRHELRLPIADSKKLYNRKTGHLALERTALVMLATAQRRPRTLRGLIKTLAPAALDGLAEIPWYGPLDGAVPTCTTAADIATRANAASRDMQAQDIRLAGVYVELLPADEFNRRVTQTHNKASVLMSLALRIVQRMLAQRSDAVRICVDRHGGREHYVDHLLTFFDGGNLKVLEESPQRSAYRIEHGGKRFSIEFVTKGESRHLPIALASVFAKYLRELLMGELNAYFAARVSGVKPTAGYYTDAQRFLADIAPAIAAERIATERLVRSR